MARGDAEMRIRLPAAEKAFLEEASKRNLRTQNAEIIVAIRQRMERETAAQAA